MNDLEDRLDAMAILMSRCLIDLDRYYLFESVYNVFNDIEVLIKERSEDELDILALAAIGVVIDHQKLASESALFPLHMKEVVEFAIFPMTMNIGGKGLMN